MRRDVAVRGIGHGIGRGGEGALVGGERDRPRHQCGRVHVDCAGKRATADDPFQLTVGGRRLGKRRTDAPAGQACDRSRSIAFEIVPRGGVAVRRGQAAVHRLRAVNIILERLVVRRVQIDRLRHIEGERRQIALLRHGRARLRQRFRRNKHPRRQDHQQAHDHGKRSPKGRFGSVHNESSFKMK